MTMPTYEPLSARMLTDPYPIYSELRTESPVYWHEQMGSWVLTRYRDCWSVLRDPATFASDWRKAGYAMPGTDHPSLMMLDPPEHTPIRRLLINAVHRQDLTSLGELAEKETRAHLERMTEKASFDFVSEVARPVSVHVISRFMGIDPPDVASFFPLADAIERGMDAYLVPEAIEPARTARRRFDTMMKAWAADVSHSGLLADLLRERKAMGVPAEAVWSTARVMFLAGFSATVASSANAVLTLLAFPDALQRMRDPELLDSGIEELLRYESPTQGTSRMCVETTAIGGVRIERGKRVLLLFGAANRDPEQFPAPDELVLDRRPNRHLAFGWGPHACAGALLAKCVLRALIYSLLELPAPPRPAGPVSRRTRATLRYPAELPITLQQSHPGALPRT
jgi:cytochrome P450